MSLAFRSAPFSMRTFHKEDVKILLRRQFADSQLQRATNRQYLGSHRPAMISSIVQWDFFNVVSRVHICSVFNKKLKHASVSKKHIALLVKQSL